MADEEVEHAPKVGQAVVEIDYIPPYKDREAWLELGRRMYILGVPYQLCRLVVKDGIANPEHPLLSYYLAKAGDLKSFESIIPDTESDVVGIIIEEILEAWHAIIPASAGIRSDRNIWRKIIFMMKQYFIGSYVRARIRGEIVVGNISTINYYLSFQRKQLVTDPEASDRLHLVCVE